MPNSRSIRECRFNPCCCNPFVLCSSMLGLRRNPLCRSFLGECIPIICLTNIAARKPSSSSNTAIPPSKNTNEATSSEAMADHTPAVNGSQKHDSLDIDKPAVIAKEPEVSKSMVYEPLPVKKPNGFNNGTTNHTSHSVTQRKTIHLLKVFVRFSDQNLILQALNPMQIPPNTGANPVSHSPKTSRSQFFKRRLSQRGESLSPISMMLMKPISIA